MDKSDASNSNIPSDPLFLNLFDSADFIQKSYRSLDREISEQQVPHIVSVTPEPNDIPDLGSSPVGLVDYVVSGEEFLALAHISSKRFQIS